MKIWEQIKKRNWGKGHVAQTARGEDANYDDVDACKWCADGWLLRVYMGSDNYIEARHKLAKVIGRTYSGIEPWNDNARRTFAEVKAAFKRADL